MYANFYPELKCGTLHEKNKDIFSIKYIVESFFAHLFVLFRSCKPIAPAYSFTILNKKIFRYLYALLKNFEVKLYFNTSYFFQYEKKLSYLRF